MQGFQASLNESYMLCPYGGIKYALRTGILISSVVILFTLSLCACLLVEESVFQLVGFSLDAVK